MSKAHAISTVTVALLKLLGKVGAPIGNPDDDITAKPPDKARGAKTGPQLNLFLYHVGINAAWRNRDMPGQVRDGERARPPLPLDLFYLLTAYGSNDDDREGHLLMGRALQILHDNPLIADLSEQPERVRLTFQPFGAEDQYKLWSTFQTQYRLSAAFQVSVVLIDSEQTAAAAPPVIRRGAEDRGPEAFPSSLPVLEKVVADVTPPTASAQLGDNLRIVGQNLPTSGAKVRFTSSRLPAPIDLDPIAGGTATAISVQLPGDAAAAAWVPGFYTVSLVWEQPPLPPLSSNQVPFTLAPKIARSPAGGPAGVDLLVTVTVNPRVRKGQQVLLIFGSQPVAGPDITATTDTVKILVPKPKTGTYLLRLRVDGVDSLPVRRTGTPARFEFNPDLVVTVP